MGLQGRDIGLEEDGSDGDLDGFRIKTILPSFQDVKDVILLVW